MEMIIKPQSGDIISFWAHLKLRFRTPLIANPEQLSLRWLGSTFAQYLQTKPDSSGNTFCCTKV